MPESYICPHCRNPIDDHEALLCHFCGESLRRPAGGFLSRLKYAHQAIVIMVAALMLVSFILLLVF